MRGRGRCVVGGAWRAAVTPIGGGDCVFDIVRTCRFGERLDATHRPQGSVLTETYVGLHASPQTTGSTAHRYNTQAGRLFECPPRTTVVPVSGPANVWPSHWCDVLFGDVAIETIGPGQTELQHQKSGPHATRFGSAITRGTHFADPSLGCQMKCLKSDTVTCRTDGV